MPFPSGTGMTILPSCQPSLLSVIAAGLMPSSVTCPRTFSFCIRSLCKLVYQAAVNYLDFLVVDACHVCKFLHRVKVCLVLSYSQLEVQQATATTLRTAAACTLIRAVPLDE